MLHHESIGSGPPVLLLPGMLGTINTDLRAIMQPIADMGHTVIAADLPGHGQSDMTKSISLRVMTEEVEKLMQGLKLDPVVIFGYSLGGYVGLSYTLRNVHRVVGVWMHASKFYWSGAEAEDMAATMDVNFLQQNRAEYLELLRSEHGDKLEELLPWLQKMTGNLPDTGLTEMELEEFEVPVMVSAGDRDELVPVEEAVQLYRALRGGQLTIFPDTNHPISSLRDHVFLPVFKDFLNRLD